MTARVGNGVTSKLVEIQRQISAKVYLAVIRLFPKDIRSNVLREQVDNLLTQCQRFIDIIRALLMRDTAPGLDSKIASKLI